MEPFTPVAWEQGTLEPAQKQIKMTNKLTAVEDTSCLGKSVSAEMENGRKASW